MATAVKSRARCAASVAGRHARSQRTVAFWMGSFSATGRPRIAPSILAHDENWLASHNGGGRWNWRCRACTAFQTNSTCEVGTAKQTRSHVSAFNVSSDIGRTEPNALRATPHVTTRRQARQ